MSDPVAFLREVPEGTRVVVRYRLHDDTAGATDALGFVTARNATQIAVATPRGLMTIDYVDVIAAKPVPPAPTRRSAAGS